MVDLYLSALGQAELVEGLFGQAELAGIHDMVIVHHIEHGQDPLAVIADFHLGQGLETLGAIQDAVPVQVGDVFTVGVDGHPTQIQFALAGVGPGRCRSFHAMSVLWSMPAIVPLPIPWMAPRRG